PQGPSGPKGDTGATGPQGPAGPQGLAGISGYEEKTQQVFVPVGAFMTISVSCPAGKKVLGGGFDIETPDDVKVFSSEPSSYGNVIDSGWRVIAQNDGRVGPRQVTAIAICAAVQSVKLGGAGPRRVRQKHGSRASWGRQPVANGGSGCVCNS